MESICQETMQKYEFHENLYIKNHDCKSSTQKLEMPLILLLIPCWSPPVWSACDIHSVFCQIKNWFQLKTKNGNLEQDAPGNMKKW